ncbi:ANTAR domain-containing protein [Streptomyces sp. NBC_00386]|uniref:ANTAR domain-containing protein n=1 Tax=Streptomyces sp. NBC_00386 TaxID=2975734 RepID=UPI003FCE7F02
MSRLITRSCARARKRGAGTVTQRPRPKRGRPLASEPLAPSQDRHRSHPGDTDRSLAATATWGAEDSAAADEAAAVQKQAGRPRHAWAVHAVIDQATGVVMALGRLRADQARTVLTEVSQRTNVTLYRIAELLTAWAHTSELNLGIRIALEEAIRQQHRTRR